MHEDSKSFKEAKKKQKKELKGSKLSSDMYFGNQNSQASTLSPGMPKTLSIRDKSTSSVISSTHWCCYFGPFEKGKMQFDEVTSHLRNKVPV